MSERIKLLAPRLLITLGLLAITTQATKEDRPFKVLDSSNKDSIWLQPYIAPPLEFRLIQGQVPENFVECKQGSRIEIVGDRRIVTIILDCPNDTILQLIGVDLER